MPEALDILQEVPARFPDAGLTAQPARDGIPTLWVSADRAKEVLAWLKRDVARPFRMLYDLTAIDERLRAHRDGQPESDFTVVYHLFSFDRNADLRLKVPLTGDTPSLPTISGLWGCANWYEREVWDMFGITITGHPNLRRLLLPPWWEGHALRKEHPARRTEMGPFHMDEETQEAYERMMSFDYDGAGMACELEDFDCMILNIGPHHPSTHGVIRFVAQLAGQEITELICDIGYHHRGQEKMAERQSWHTYLPYTDRVDYLGGVMNNFPYVMAVETLAGIAVPDRAKVIRIMLAELFRIISHLVFLGTFAQDIGMMSPVFYLFTDRERAFTIVEAITGGRMHPSWFRIGGVAQDLPDGWQALVREFLDYLPGRLRIYEKVMLKNRIFRQRTLGISPLRADDAIEWGATGPLLRACGLPWDLRKMQPYGGYDQFEFDVPVGEHGDCYDRAAVHVAEMRQSLRIMEQCLENMPDGPYKSAHPLTTPPRKERTLHDIETLIDHFLGATWGPVIPAGEACGRVEGTKGQYSYYLISDGDVSAYRNRIRTPCFPHIQMTPMLARGLTVSDLVAILGSLDYVVAEIDR